MVWEFGGVPGGSRGSSYEFRGDAEGFRGDSGGFRGDSGGIPGWFPADGSRSYRHPSKFNQNIALNSLQYSQEGTRGEGNKAAAFEAMHLTAVLLNFNLSNVVFTLV